MSVCQRVEKLQIIKVFQATYFATLCTESLLIGSPRLILACSFVSLWPVCLWRGQIHTERHVKAQGCARWFLVLWDLVEPFDSKSKDCC